MRELRRIVAFLKGDFAVAEGLDKRPQWPPVAWVTASASSDEEATYALEACIRSATDADAAVKSVQGKAQSLLTLVLALFPLAVATTILVVPSNAGSGTRFAAFLCFLATDLFLVGAAIKTLLASGLVLSGGFNPENVHAASAAKLPRLKVEEADAWYAAARVAFWSGASKARDLFGARRLLIAATLTAVLATPFLYLADSEARVPAERCEQLRSEHRRYLSLDDEAVAQDVTAEARELDCEWEKTD